MQKVYRLLRNNQEMGPYTLEELLQKELKPHDLIWMEGKSAAWAYPYELEALKPYAPAPPRQPAAATPASEAQRNPAGDSERHIFVRLPDQQRRPAQRAASDSIEERAEAIRQRTRQLQTAAAALPDADLHTRYAQTLDNAGHTYTQWYYNRKMNGRKKLRKGLLPAVLMLAILTGAFFAGQRLLQKSNQPPELSGPNPKPPAAATTVLQQQTQAADTILSPADSTATLVAQTPDAHPVTFKKPLQNKPQAAPALPQTPKATEVVPAAAPATTTQPPAPVVQENTALPETTTVVPVEKKRKGLFGGLFRKKDEDRNTASQNKILRREEPAAVAAPGLGDGIELRSDATRENWMLGVLGQQLTLLNHNSQPIRTAVVAVYYFGADNALLERKTVTVGSIAPRAKATVALPDHRQAERVTFQVLSAE